MYKEKATEKISFRATETLKKKIEKRAEEEGRTPSNFIINVVTAAVRFAHNQR